MSRSLPVTAADRGVVGGIRGRSSVGPDSTAGRGLLGGGGDALASTRPSLRPTLNQPVILIQTRKFFLIKCPCSARLASRRRLVAGGSVSREKL